LTSGFKKHKILVAINEGLNALYG